MGSFASIAGAETALARESARHVFEIAALLRVSHTLYNYRMWVVGAGNGIFGCRDWRPKIHPKDRNCRQRPEALKMGDKIPAETASFRSTTVCAVREDWMVVCAVRYEPVSMPNSLLSGNLTGNFAFFGLPVPNSLQEVSLLQPLLP